MDIRVVNAGQNSSGGIIAAHVRELARGNALLIAQVNASGDIVNPGGGAGGVASNINIDQVAGAATAANSGNADNGTLRVVIASDQPTIPVSFPSGLTIGAITAPIGISGDVSTTPKAGSTWPVSLSGTINTREQGSPGVQIIGGSVGGRVSISGDSLTVTANDLDIRNLNPAQDSIHVSSGRVGVTGDVSTTPKAGSTWPVSIAAEVLVREQGVSGVQIVGGSLNGRVSISGDSLTVTASNLDIRSLNPSEDSIRIHGGVVGVSGDVLLRSNTGTDIGNVGIKTGQEINTREQAKTGVHVSAGQIGVSGDVSTTPAAGQVWPIRQTSPQSFSISGDGGVQATVRDYTNANPIAVVLTNASGDTYNPAPQVPTLLTVAGRATVNGSNAIVSAIGGRRIKVYAYDLQGEDETSRGYFASGASGSQLSPEWEFNAREGVSKAIDPASKGYLFATAAGAALSLELTAVPAMKYSVSYFAE